MIALVLSHGTKNLILGVLAHGLKSSVSKNLQRSRDIFNEREQTSMKMLQFLYYSRHANQSVLLYASQFLLLKNKTNKI